MEGGKIRAKVNVVPLLLTFGGVLARK